jgi:hypothetical protein
MQRNNEVSSILCSPSKGIIDYSPLTLLHTSSNAKEKLPAKYVDNEDDAEMIAENEEKIIEVLPPKAAWNFWKTIGLITTAEDEWKDHPGTLEEDRDDEGTDDDGTSVEFYTPKSQSDQLENLNTSGSKTWRFSGYDDEDSDSDGDYDLDLDKASLSRTYTDIADRNGICNPKIDGIHNSNGDDNDISRINGNNSIEIDRTDSTDKDDKIDKPLQVLVDSEDVEREREDIDGGESKQQSIQPSLINKATNVIPVEDNSKSSKLGEIPSLSLPLVPNSLPLVPNLPPRPESLSLALTPQNTIPSSSASKVNDNYTGITEREESRHFVSRCIYIYIYIYICTYICTNEYVYKFLLY